MTIAPTSVTVVYSWRDERGAVSRPRAHHAYADIPAISADASGLASALMAASGCSLQSYSLNFDFREEAPNMPGETLKNYVAVLLFGCADGELYEMELPGFKPSLLSGETPAVDVDATSAAMEALASALIDGGFTNYDGVALTEFLGGALEIMP